MQIAQVPVVIHALGTAPQPLPPNHFAFRDDRITGGILENADETPMVFGKKVLAAWWVPSRGLYEFSKWGYIGASASDTNRVTVMGSAEQDAGQIEASVFVLFE